MKRILAIKIIGLPPLKCSFMETKRLHYLRLPINNFYNNYTYCIFNFLEFIIFILRDLKCAILTPLLKSYFSDNKTTLL